MGNSCGICNHPERLAIDRELVEGKSKADIARRFGVSDDAVRNHGDNHLSRQLVKAHERKEIIHAADLVTRIESLLSKSENILSEAEKKKQFTLALNAIRESRSTLELLYKIAAHLHEVRRLELEAKQEQGQVQDREDSEQRAREFFDLAEQRLSKDELHVFMDLYNKIAGEHMRDVLQEVREQRFSLDEWDRIDKAERRKAKAEPEQDQDQQAAGEPEREKTALEKAKDFLRVGVW